MPDFRVSPISIVNQIKSNLQDRYDTGYPILKELLQNADDSGANQFRLDARPGWPDAANPLLRGPGLLVVNDGVFRKEDQRGITSFGESDKATDNAVIGKFGFGQKSVFHLCDAFLVYAYGGHARRMTVPWIVSNGVCLKLVSNSGNTYPRVRFNHGAILYRPPAIGKKHLPSFSRHRLVGTLFTLKHIITCQWDGIDSARQLSLENHQSAVTEADFACREIKLPHTAEPIAIKPDQLLAIR